MHAGVVVVVLPRQFFAFLSLQSKHKGEKERERPWMMKFFQRLLHNYLVFLAFDFDLRFRPSHRLLGVKQTTDEAKRSKQTTQPAKQSPPFFTSSAFTALFGLEICACLAVDALLYYYPALLSFFHKSIYTVGVDRVSLRQCLFFKPLAKAWPFGLFGLHASSFPLGLLFTILFDLSGDPFSEWYAF